MKFKKFYLTQYGKKEKAQIHKIRIVMMTSHKEKPNTVCKNNFKQFCAFFHYFSQLYANKIHVK